jgi:hypothetical protein
MQEYMYRDTMGVEPGMNDYTGNKWSHGSSNNRFKDKCGSHTRQTFNRFTTKESYTRNITHNTERTAV